MSYMAGSEPAPCAPEPSHAQSGSSGCDRPLLHLADGHPDPATDFTLRGCRASETVGEPDMRLERIISGGQTGADRAALDFAITHSIPHGGWCPKGRRAEDGVIPGQYVLQETPSRDYRQRTEWNVRDSDATVIFTIGATLTGGSKLTAEFAARHGKPWLHLPEDAPGDPAGRLHDFLATHAVKVLNVAGSRASKEPDVAKFVEGVLAQAFEYHEVEA